MRRGYAATLAITVGALTVSGCGGSQPASSSAGDGAPLWRVVSKLADDDGAQLISAQAVRTTQRAGTGFMATTPFKAGKIPARAVWLVMGRTNKPLECECAVVPGRDGHTDGRIFLVLLDTKTHEVVGGAALLTDQPDLTKLGTPIDLGR